ncbi:MAG: TlpA disulfide reductase family protein [Geothrix sp.]|nr:TlpA disulfide reductase family protein [Geothrix sp.]
MSLPLICLMTALPAMQAPAPVNEAQAVLEAARAKAKSVMDARAAFMRAGGNSKDFKGDCTKELADLEARLAVEQRPDLRHALLISKLYHLQLAKLAPSPALLDQVRKEVPPTAAAWGVDMGLILQLADETVPGWGPYVTEARVKHPDPGLRRHLLFEYFWDRLDARDESAWKPAYATLQSEFADSRQAKQAKELLESEQKTGIGRPAPTFSLGALDDPKTTYTLDSFKGRYVLLDFWATWCPPCRAEMPLMHAAWSKFKAKPFDILSLSFDRRIEHIAPYRQQAATPMPWKHAFIERGFQNPVSDAYGVKGIPKPLLIGPDGKIVASGSELRGANLEKTLEKFLGK